MAKIGSVLTSPVLRDQARGHPAATALLQLAQSSDEADVKGLRMHYARHVAPALAVLRAMPASVRGTELHLSREDTDVSL